MSISAIVLSLLVLSAAAQPQTPSVGWNADVKAALDRAERNRAVLERALTNVPKEQHRALVFLLVNMPDADLRSLSDEFLLRNIDLAYQARKVVPWGAKVPEEVFFNNVLPYANVDEKRDEWRQEFFDTCLPLVKDCRTPAEAAQKLNVELFKTLKVGYSTQRRAPNQSPKESIARGKASCTGLSIMLTDACRAVCVPARVVGTPLWSNKRGNHTWVEIWDEGWHFTGACEADPSGLDRGWFVGEAAQAQRDSFEHAIYAASFKRSGTHFALAAALGGTAVQHRTGRLGPLPR